MRKNIYDDGDIQVLTDGSRYFIRYDAGAHQIVIREDEITSDEANKIINNATEITNVLFSLQRRLQNAGIDPYKSNI